MEYLACGFSEPMNRPHRQGFSSGLMFPIPARRSQTRKFRAYFSTCPGDLCREGVTSEP